MDNLNTRVVEKSEFDRMYNSIEQLRTRIDSNFDTINSLLREVTSTLAALNTQMPLQKEDLNILKVNVEELEDRVADLEISYAKVKGMTTTAKFVWGIIIAVISFIVSNVGNIIRAFHG